MKFQWSKLNWWNTQSPISNIAFCLPHKQTNNQMNEKKLTYHHTGTRSGSWLAVIDTLDPCVTLPAQAFDAVR